MFTESDAKYEYKMLAFRLRFNRELIAGTHQFISRFKNHYDE